MRMRNIIIPALLVALLSVSLPACDCGCDDEIIIDYYPVVFRINVVDAEGNDLLANGAIDVDQVTIKVGGEEFGVYPFGAKELDANSRYDLKPRKAPSLRAYKPHFYGAYVEKDSTTSRHCISIGEFDGAEDYNPLRVSIIWPDGKEDRIEYFRKVKRPCAGIDIESKVKLNGSEIPRGSITIVK